MWGFQSRKNVYWDGRRPTSLWLIPFAIGLVSGALPYLINHELFDESSLMGSVGISALLAIGLLALPDSKTDRKIEMLAGIWIEQFPMGMYPNVSEYLRTHPNTSKRVRMDGTRLQASKNARKGAKT